MLELAAGWIEGSGTLATAVRTILVYAFALGVVRAGSKRALSKASAFDVVVAIMLGSIMSRAITSPSDMWANLLSGAVLIAAHWLVAALAYRLDWLGPIVKGRPRTLVRDGQVDRAEMRRAGVSEHDLEQALRLQARATDTAHVRLAVLERDGAISVIRQEKAPQVVDVSVADGVQTVRLELS